MRLVLPLPLLLLLLLPLCLFSVSSDVYAASALTPSRANGIFRSFPFLRKLRSVEENEAVTVPTTTTTTGLPDTTNYNDVEAKSSGAFDEPTQEDLIEAADFGVEAMNDLYTVKEPKLYKMGLFLSDDNPARYVAAFNAPTEEAQQLTRFGYAALEATKKFRAKYPTTLRQTLIPQNIPTTLSEQCPKKGTPQCNPASKRYRTTDGSCNNRKHPWWGSSMSSFQRFLPAVYENGIDQVRRSVNGRLLPSARQISDYVHEERDAPLISVSHMLMQWGQFVDHDLTATAQSRAFKNSVPQCCLFLGTGFQPPELTHPDCMPIVVDPEDSHLSQFDVRCLEFVRSAPAPSDHCDFGPREQLNQVTSYIDGSAIYSSTARQGDTLRIFRNGMMQYGKMESQRPLLPRRQDDSDMCRRGSLSTSCFKAGDGRLSEQPALISLHVVFLRLHNRIATQLSALNPHWSDEKIFQEARKIIGALVQHITYREFLPIVLGQEVTKIFDLQPVEEGYYKGYDPSVNPHIANAFASAAFRFGHSLVQQSFVRFDKNHRPIFNNVTIHEEFSNPSNLESAGSVDRILLGLVNQPAQKRDVFISEELTNHLFQTPQFQFGMDLAAINIQRGRDHGIPPFVQWREPCVLSPVKNWDDLERIMPSETARKFRELYDAVEDVDLFSGGLAEKPVAGGLVGPTFACIIAQQFSHLRKGDRFWYENPFPESGFTPDQLEQIRKVTLAQILCRTMDNIDSIQPFVMLMSDNLRNKRVACDDPLLEQLDLNPWIDKSFKLRRETLEDDNGLHSVIEEVINIAPPTRKAKSRAVTQNQVKSNLQRIRSPVAPGLPKPIKTKVNQHNRIFVQRPLGPGENLTIVVNNHAVNAPVFVSDSIYGSNYHVNNPYIPPHHPRPEYQRPPPPGPQAPPPSYEYNEPSRPPPPPPPAYGSPAYGSPSTQRPGGSYNEPQPQTPSYSMSDYNYNSDPSNPNPPIYDPNNARPKPPRPPTAYGPDGRPNPQPPVYSPDFPNNEFFTYNNLNFATNQPQEDSNQNYIPSTTRRPRPTNSYQEQQLKQVTRTQESNTKNKNIYQNLEPNKSHRDQVHHSNAKKQKRPSVSSDEYGRNVPPTQSTKIPTSSPPKRRSTTTQKPKTQTIGDSQTQTNTRSTVKITHESTTQANYQTTDNDHSTNSSVKHADELVVPKSIDRNITAQVLTNDKTTTTTVKPDEPNKNIESTTSVTDDPLIPSTENFEKVNQDSSPPLLKISLDVSSDESADSSSASDELPRPIIFKKNTS